MNPWEASITDPVGQVKSIAFKKRNGMGGRSEILNTESELIKLYSGKRLSDSEILRLSSEFNLHLIGLYVGGAYNPKHTKDKFNLFRTRISDYIKFTYLDPLTDISNRTPASNEAKPNDPKPKDISSAYDTISRDELHMEHK